ncbi:hypothetical protein [Micromonospora sp. I033]
MTNADTVTGAVGGENRVALSSSSVSTRITSSAANSTTASSTTWPSRMRG